MDNKYKAAIKELQDVINEVYMSPVELEYKRIVEEWKRLKGMEKKRHYKWEFRGPLHTTKSEHYVSEDKIEDYCKHFNITNSLVCKIEDDFVEE
jgi:hypothetical protein